MTKNNRRFLLPAVVSLLFSLLCAAHSRAATFTVSSLASIGPGSLFHAVLAANAAAGPDEIVFTVTGTITTGDLLVTDSLLVAGPGAGAITVSGNDLSRIFFIESPAMAAIDVTLSGLTLTRGRALFGGGAVMAVGENLTILNSVISDGESGEGFDPGVDGCGGNVSLNGGSLRIVNSVLTGGLAVNFGASTGGNVCVFEGSLTLERTTLSGGSANRGGGLSLVNATATVLSSTISGNEAGDGGGVYVESSQVQFLNSTISGNEAFQTGGGIHTVSSQAGSIALRLTTVASNTASSGGGNLHQDGSGSGFQLDHSIVANGTPSDIDVTTGSYTASYSLIEAPVTLPAAGSNNLLVVDPLLGPLAGNGGPTLTHLPLPGSPVIDAGNPAIPAPPATDQRGLARIAGPAVDLGSVEAGAFGVAAVPTLSEWSLFLLSGLLLAVGVWRLRA